MADTKIKPEPTFETTSKIPVEPLYTPADLDGWDLRPRSRLPR